MDRTTNYNLKKPSTADSALVGDLNDNMDIVDTQLKAANDRIVSAQDGLGILATGNTHAAIAKGQAVFVRNHSSLSDGLYWATAAISANGALSTSNLTADTSGGLNKLHDDITTLNSKITNIQEYASNKSSSDYPVGIFPFYIANNTVIGSTEVTGNCRGVALNIGSAIHFFVCSATGARMYMGGWYQGWYLTLVTSA